MLYPIQPRSHFGREAAAYWDDFLTNEEIMFLSYRQEWKLIEEAKIGENELNNEIRKTDVAWLPLSIETQDIWDKLTRVVSEVNRRFFHFDLTGCWEPMQLGLYSANNNSHYDWHTDASALDRGVPRKLTMALSLSDPMDYEGGELQIKTDSDNPIVLENIKGRAWFFPSYTLHRVTPVTRGLRKSIVLWIGGPQFR